MMFIMVPIHLLAQATHESFTEYKKDTEGTCKLVIR